MGAGGGGCLTILPFNNFYDFSKSPSVQRETDWNINSFSGNLRNWQRPVVNLHTHPPKKQLKQQKKRENYLENGKMYKKGKCYKNENMYFQKKNPQFFFFWLAKTDKVSPLVEQGAHISTTFHQLEFPHFFSETKKKIFEQKVEKFCRANFFCECRWYFFFVKQKRW